MLFVSRNTVKIRPVVGEPESVYTLL
ncbi:hypothetical protein VCCP103710_1307, partial [Vibrio cholerae CP1037(10)]